MSAFDPLTDPSAKIKRFKRPAPPEPEPQPMHGEHQPIRLVDSNLVENVTDGEKALARDVDRLNVYQRGTFLVRPGHVQIVVSGGRKIPSLQIIPLEADAVREALTDAAAWEKWDAKKSQYVRKSCPDYIARTLVSRVGQWHLPVLAGIISAPTLRADGSILDVPGYDRQTHLLFDPQGVSFAPIPRHPSKDQAATALGEIRELLHEFPFVGRPDWSVGLSGALTSVIRLSLPQAPLHSYSAPTPGSGKSYLVDCLSLIANGREAQPITPGDTEVEMEKRLSSLLLRGEPAIALDNCQGPLGGEFLSAMLTQSTVKPRVLGKSITPTVPTGAFVTATGNNLVLSGDTPRRSILCQLDPLMERPELRRFGQKPDVMIRQDRSRYVVAALTILRAYHVAGMPGKPAPLQSFEAWSDLVRGALIWLGEADPVLSMEAVREADPDLGKRRALIEQWHEVLGREPTTVKRLTERAVQSDCEGLRFPELYDALMAIAGNRNSIDSDALGKWLRSNKNRVIGQWKIVTDGTSHKTAKWKLAPRLEPSPAG